MYGRRRHGYEVTEISPGHVERALQHTGPGERNTGRFRGEVRVRAPEGAVQRAFVYPDVGEVSCDAY
jgi:hypothetical protein